MQADLASIESAALRWRFARSCALAIIRRPAHGELASLGIPVVIVFATVLLTVRTAYPPMHTGLIAMMAVLGVLYVAGDRLVAPCATGSRLSAAVRAGGALALASVGLGIVMTERSGDGNVADRAGTGLPIFTVLIAVYLLGFLAMTSRALADTWVLVHGIGLGVTAAVLWLVMALDRPPLPLSSGSAFAVLTVAILVAAMTGAPRGAAVLTALCTSVIGTLSIFILAQLALEYGPPGWVPADSAAFTQAARLAQSRVEAGEPYLQIVLVGALAALGILTSALRCHRAATRFG